VYTKYDGHLHWHQTMLYLGEDEHGIWLGAPGGSTIRRGNEPPIVLDQPSAELIPPGQWWTATFNGEPAKTDIYCDISTPPEWPSETEVTMVDLDLDVLRLRADGRVLIVDQDEFAAHMVRYSYPADVITQAERAAASLHRAISAGCEPFASRYREWLQQVS
jgi:protein associated with RNAse G/E